MALILHIETSTEVCSVALSRDGKILFSKIDRDGPSHAVLIGPFVEEALKKVDETADKLQAVAVSSGPGSYTGLRIGVSIAKGICFALNIPLIAIGTLEIIADTCKKLDGYTQDMLIRPMIDARRMEVYTSLLDNKLTTLEKPNALIVDETTFTDELKNNKICFAGNGAAKIKNIVNSENAFFPDNIVPLAESMVEIAENYFSEGRFVDVAYFEPFYLKEFVATISKKNII